MPIMHCPSYLYCLQAASIAHVIKYPLTNRKRTLCITHGSTIDYARACNPLMTMELLLLLIYTCNFWQDVGFDCND